MPARRHAPLLRACLVMTLLGCAWFASHAPLWALDLEGMLTLGQRSDAMHQLAQARENVEHARAEATAARALLDDFLARHFAGDSRGEPAPPSVGDNSKSVVEMRPNPELARLKTQLHELRTRRQELLGYLTDEHPEVVDVQERIESVETRIAILFDVMTEDDAAGRDRSTEIEARWAEYVGRLQENREQAAAEYEQLYQAWQAAELAVAEARAVEVAAAERLEALSAPTAGLAESGPAAPDATDELTASREPFDASRDADRATDHAAEADTAGSQPLVLAALLIALAVAALAAVRLARSSADPTFASVDEVAAALAIPVVGIIPATAARLQRRRSDESRRPSWFLVAELLLAGLVFAVVAYGVQNPGDLWRVCSHPLQALGSLFRSVGS